MNEKHGEKHAIESIRKSFAEDCWDVEQRDDVYLLKPKMSRRSFLGLTAGLMGMVALEALIPGIGLPDAAAFAWADEGEGEYGFVITVVSKEEIGVIARDVKTQNVLRDASVWITSHFGKQEKISGKTDQYGVFVFNARRYSENAGDDDASRYEFWGKIESHKDGYRDFETGLFRFVSGPPIDGRGVQIPFQTYTDPTYVALLTYDGFDIQYSTTTIAIASGNDADHTLRMVVVGNDGNGSTVSATLYHDGVALMTREGYIRDCRTTIDFVGKFNQGFKPGKETKVKFFLKGRNQVTEIVTRLVCEKKTTIESGFTGEGAVSPGGDARASAEGETPGDLPGYHLTLPKEIPVVGGMNFDLNLPALPVYIYYDPFGALKAVVDLSLMKENTKWDGTVDKGQWKFVPYENRKAYDERRNRENEEAKARYRKTKDVAANKGAKFGSAPKFSSIRLKFGFLFELSALWKFGSSGQEWEGDASATFSFDLDYEAIKQFIIGPVPVFVAFDLNLHLGAIASLGVDIVGLFHEVSWAVGKNGAVILMRFEVGVSVGVGIAGFVSFSVRGYGFITGELGLVNPPKDDPFPHLKAGAGVGIQYVVQALFFKMSGSLYDHEWPNLYNNWKNDPDRIDDAAQPLGYTGYFDAPTAGVPTAPDAESGYVENFWEPVDDVSIDDLVEYWAEALDEEEGDGEAIDDLSAEGNEEDASEEGEPEAVELEALLPEEDGPDADEPASPQKSETEEGGSDAEEPASPPTEVKESESDLVLAEEDAFLAEDGDAEPALTIGPYEQSRPTETGSPCSELGIVDPETSADSSYEIAHGVKPLTDTVIYGDIYSDPRNKFIKVGNDLYLARLVLVRIKKFFGSYNVSRVALSKYEGGVWGSSKVIEFEYPNTKPALVRKEVYDYDFDIVSAGGLFHVVIASGSRPGGESIKWWQAQNHMVGSYVAFNYDTGKTVRSEHYFDAYNKMTSERKYNSVAYPRAIVLNDGGSDVVFATLCDLGLYSSSDHDYSHDTSTFRGIWRTASGEAYGTLSAFYPLDISTFRKVKDVTLARCGSYNGDLSVLVGCEEEVVQGRELDLDVCTCTGNRKGDAGKVLYLKASMAAHPQGGLAVSVDDGALMLITYKGGTDFYELLDRKNIGKAPSKSFVISADGKWLFTTEAQDGKPNVVDVDDLIGPAQDGDVEVYGDPDGLTPARYQIMAAKMFQGAGTFSELFPLAQMERPIDTLSTVEFDRGSSGFMYTSITNLNKSLADIRFTTVPFVKSIQLNGAAAREDFLGPKDTCHLVLNVTNTGNVGIGSFGARLCLDKEGNDKVCDLVVGNLRENLVLSVDHYDETTGETVVDAPDKEGVFLPGRTRLYTTSFTVPADWRGTKELYVFLQNVQEASIEEFPQYGESLPEGAFMATQFDTLPSEFTLNSETDAQVASSVFPNDYASSLLPDDGKRLPDTGDGEALPTAVIAAGAAAAAIGIGAAAKLSASDEEDGQGESPL